MAALMLKVKMVNATNLPNVERKREHSDPYAKVTYKSKTHKTKTIEENSNPNWNETLEFELAGPLKANEVLDVVVKDYEKLGSDRTLAQGKIPLKDCLSRDNAPVKVSLVGANGERLENCSLNVVLDYNGAKTPRPGGGGAAAPAGGITATSEEGGLMAVPGGADEADSSGGAVGDAGYGGEVEVVSAWSENAGAMPDLTPEKPPTAVKESLRSTLPKKPVDYQVRVKVWEARQLKGGGIKPVVKVRVGNQSKNTKIKAGDSPYFNEQFFYSFKMIPVDLFDEVIECEVCNSQRFRSDAVIGTFKLDIGTVWDEPNHCILRKWLLLTDPHKDSGECMGYLKISAMVLGAGDEAPADKDSMDDDADDIESNLLRPAGVQMQPATFWVRLYKAVDIPQMDTGALTSIKEFFTGDEEDSKKLVDPFVVFSFAGKRVKSSVKFHSNDPEYNEQLQLAFNFPSMCQKLKFDLRDWDQMTGDDPIAVSHIDLNSISVTGDKGFLPTYGPAWLNLYGAPREEGKEITGGSNEDLNKGKGEGCGYRGRVLIEMGSILGARPDAAVLGIAPDQVATIDKFCRTRKFRLFALFEEANLITEDANDPVQFEVSIGNYGNSLDKQSSPMPSTTPPVQPVFDGTHYYYLPIGDAKPTVAVDCDFEDITYRIGPTNMIRKLYFHLERDLKVVQLLNLEESPQVQNLSIKLLEDVVAHAGPIIKQLDSLVKRPQGNNLDRNMTSYRLEQLQSIYNEAAKEIDTVTDVSDVINSIERYLSILKFMSADAQESIPDVIIWLMESTKRIAYARIPPSTLFYSSENPDYCGDKCATSQTIQLKFPHKKAKKEHRVPANVRCKLWFGLQKDQSHWQSQQPAGAMLTTVAETIEHNSYFPITKWKDAGFHDASKSMALPKEGFKPPSGWKFDGDWFISRDKSTEINPDEGMDEFVDDIYESQVRLPGTAWRSPSEKAWVNPQGEEMPERDSIQAPEGWEWVEDDGWRYDTDRAVDEDGWEYCVDVDFGGWTSSCKPYHVWRRRRWIRIRHKKKDATGALKAKKVAEKTDEGWEYSKFGSNWHKVESTIDTKRRRRWHRKLSAASPNAEPIFFFEFPNKKKDNLAPIKIAPRTLLSFEKALKFELRAYIYQARDLLSADDEGYSDPYCRVIINNRSLKTEIIRETVNPTWNQTLIFKNIDFYSDLASLEKNPPEIIVEVFDWDSVGSDEFLGRVRAKPLVKLDPFNDRRLATLEWLSVDYFGQPAGELLCSFDLLQVVNDMPIVPAKDSKNRYVVPNMIAPVPQRYAVEILTWGLRNLQSYQLTSVDKPEVEIEIADKRIKTGIVVDIKDCPNFPSPVMSFEAMLPKENKYSPPINIKVKDNRQFGRRPVVANHRLTSLAEFKVKPPKLMGEEDSEDEMPPDMEVGSQDEQVDSPTATEQIVVHIDEGGSDEVHGDHMQEGTSSAIVALPEPTFTSAPSEVASTPNVPLELSAEEIDWWTKFYASDPDPEKAQEKAEEYLRAGYPTIQRLTHELEELPGLENLQDFLRTFRLDKGKKSADDEGEYMGEFKGAIVLYPLPSNPKDPKPGPFFDTSALPSTSPVDVLLRLYIIKAEGLQPMDESGSSDPYINIECGKKYICDKENYIGNTVEPVFGKMFEFTVSLPAEKDLTIQIYDYDLTSTDDIIGQTVIDLENRYLSKHRALCGVPMSYDISGPQQWRDNQTPKQILESYCLTNKMKPPVWRSNAEVFVNKKLYKLESFETKLPRSTAGPPEERLSLYVLNQLPIVKEHVERRSLFNPAMPDMDQGQLHMWLDMFPLGLGPPGPPVDITPRLPTKYQLRIVVYNAKETIMDETSITGEEMSDIYVKGWLEGLEHETQKTDVHYRCMDGTGMFNWRFVFDFNYNPAEKQIIIKKKEHFWSLDETETYAPARLNLQVWDNDLISADDFLGTVTMNLDKIPQPAKTAKSCSLAQLEKHAEYKSIFKHKRLRGFWPVYQDLGDESGKTIASKLEMEIELVDGSEIEEKPCGKARDEPNANPKLEPPERPATSFFFLLSPFKTLKFIIWKKGKWYFIGGIILVLLILLMAFFIYQMPTALLQWLLP